jgi:hypothetical protein
MHNENTSPEDELGRELDEGAPNACKDSEFPGLDQLTAEAQAAMTKLGANDAEHIRLALEFGSVIAKAKEKLRRRGEFSRWCRRALNRKPTWCSAYRRLYENREDLQPTQKWASETEHKWANCRSVERLLKLIEDYKKTTGAAPDKPPRRRAAPDGVAALERRVNGCEKTVVALLDAVAPYWAARARKLAEANSDPNKGLAELALRIRMRAGDQGAPCGAPQGKSSEPAGLQPGQVGHLLDDALTQGVLQ